MTFYGNVLKGFGINAQIRSHFRIRYLWKAEPQEERRKSMKVEDQGFLRSRR